jgi:hypothetical protein
MVDRKSKMRIKK